MRSFSTFVSRLIRVANAATKNGFQVCIDSSVIVRVDTHNRNYSAAGLTPAVDECRALETIQASDFHLSSRLDSADRGEMEGCCHKVIINLGPVERVSDGILNLFSKRQRLMSEMGSRIVLCNVTPTLLSQLQNAGIYGDLT